MTLQSGTITRTTTDRVAELDDAQPEAGRAETGITAVAPAEATGDAESQSSPADGSEDAIDLDPAEREARELKELFAKMHTFSAMLEVAEIDERARPGPSWPSRATAVSGKALVFESRRMCHLGRHLLIGVHMVDDEPMPLFGRVRKCEYHAEGQYLVSLQLLHLPQEIDRRSWVEAVQSQSRSNRVRLARPRH